METRPFDPAAYLDSEEAIAAFLADAAESEDSGFIAHALEVVARARRMSELPAAATRARSRRPNP